MKVVQIIYSGLGGHASVAFSLINADIERKTDYHIIFYGIENINDDYVQQCKKLNIPYDFVAKKEGLDVKSYFKIYKLVRVISPDILLLHSTNAILPALANKLFGKTKIIPVEHTPNGVKTKAEWIYTLLCLLFTPKTVLLTEDYREEWKKGFTKYFLSKTIVINNGIDTNYFVQGSPQNEIIKFGMIARFSHTKDQALLVKVFNRLKQEGKIHNLKLVMPGTGDCLESVKDLIEKFGLNDHIELPGHLNESEIAKFLQTIDVYVHSSNGETMSTSIMQAMSSGLPCIGTNIVGINNLMNAGSDSILVEPHDEIGFANAITTLASDKSLREKFGKKARMHAVENFSSIRMFTEYFNMMREIK